MSFDELVKDNVIEWIESNEQQNCLLASNIDEFYANVDNKSIKYTHVDIEQSLFAVSSLIAPFFNRSQSL